MRTLGWCAVILLNHHIREHWRSSPISTGLAVAVLLSLVVCIAQDIRDLVK